MNNKAIHKYSFLTFKLPKCYDSLNKAVKGAVLLVAKTQSHSTNFQKVVAATVTASLIGIAAELYAAQIEEVVVTARKKDESLQEAAITVQAITTEALDDQDIDQLTDYVQYLPNVTAGGRGPGQNEIYIRGLAVDQINITVSEAQGSAPNVALYLDEQPVTAGGRNLDIYAADLARIEVLPGPQGTLYGASSQAGTVRLITNKPIVDETEFSFLATTATTHGGDASNSVEGVFNIPIIDNKLAIRGVLFNDSMGGYIDNVPGEFLPNPTLNPRLPSKDGIMYVPAGGDPQGHEFADGTYAEPGKVYEVSYAPASNSDYVEDNFNDAVYSGFRVGAKYLLNDSWDATLTHHQQEIHTQGVFDYDPGVGDLKVERFAPDYLDEEFGQTSLTVEGRLENLDLLYTGAYLSRDISHAVDYTEYTNSGGYIPGYLCEYNTPGYHGGGGVGYVFDPTLSGDPSVIECIKSASSARIESGIRRSTHEFRANGPIGDMLEFSAGLFFQNNKTTHIGDFDYGNTAWAPINPASISRHTANSLDVKPPGVQFVNDITRPEKEISIFGELTAHLNDQVSATLGLRNYDLQVGFEGFSAFRYGARPVPHLAGELGVNNVKPVTVGGRDYIVNLGEFQPATFTDTILKLTLAWDINDRVMLYGTASQGYRPPGFNRAAAAGQATAEGVAARGNDGPGGFPDYFIPVFYRSDAIDNLELGWKSVSEDRRLAWNGNVYRIEWTDIQVSHFDSQNISIFTIVDNGGDAEITGVETNFEFWPNESLTLWGGVSVNKTELVAVNPTFDFVVADLGSELPLTPTLQFTGRARYTWDSRLGDAYFQIAGVYAGDSWNSLVDVPVTDPRKEQEAYTLIDTSLGVKAAEGWRIEAYIKNLTNKQAHLHINRLDFRERITTNRPRTIGFRVSYEY